MRSCTLTGVPEPCHLGSRPGVITPAPVLLKYRGTLKAATNPVAVSAVRVTGRAWCRIADHSKLGMPRPNNEESGRLFGFSCPFRPQSHGWVHCTAMCKDVSQVNIFSVARFGSCHSQVTILAQYLETTEWCSGHCLVLIFVFASLKPSAP